MIETGRRGVLQGVLLLAGVAAVPGVSAKALFTGPESLPPATMVLLGAVADTLIPATDTPGAVQAGVPQMFSRLLANWASEKQRTQLLSALQAINAMAVAEKGVEFDTLAPATRFEMLDAYDRAGTGGVDYARLKDLLVTLYYMSEAGATVELRYVHSPGAWEPSLPVTAETRNPGGPGA
jgi:gluconate 2-dehydrogenase gamma chain